YAGKRPLRVPPGELAVVDLRAQQDAMAGVVWNLQLVVHRICGARRNQPHVGHRSRHPRVSLVNGIAVSVELETSEKMRSRIGGPLADVLDRTAVEQAAPLVVGCFEFHPDVERIHRAARKEMTDLSGAYDDLDANRFSAAYDDRNLVERGKHLR